MKLSVLVVTRNSSATVKTLHTILRLNVVAIKKGIVVDINFVVDDLEQKALILNKLLKNSDKVLFLDYTVSLDMDSIVKGIESDSTVIFPSVVPQVDWDMFKTKVIEGTKEPNYQIGMNFDTEVSKPDPKDPTMWSVKSANPVCFMLETSDVIRALKNKKSENYKLTCKFGNDFSLLISRNCKVRAYTDAQVMLTSTYECMGNIINAAGIKVST
jgi:hypothetical protein